MASIHLCGYPVPWPTRTTIIQSAFKFYYNNDNTSNEGFIIHKFYTFTTAMAYYLGTYRRIYEHLKHL